MTWTLTRIALFIAILSNVIPQLLTSAKADATLERQQQLLTAIQADDYELTSKLLASTELSMDETYPSTRSWLEDAALACASTVTPLFIQGGLDPNRRNMILVPILKIEKPKCRQEALLLISAGASMDFESNHQNFLTSLAHSCSAPQIAFMIQNGANPEVRDNVGHDAIYSIAQSFHSPECLRSMKALFQHPALPKKSFPIDLDVLDAAGLRPIDWLNVCFHQFTNDPALEAQRMLAILFLLQQGSPPLRRLTFAEGQAAYAKIRAAAIVAK